MGKYEEKIFQVREYDDFPKRKAGDLVIRTFDTLEEAQFESMFLNKKYDTGRFYIQDLPHEEITLTAKQRKLLKEKYGLR